MIYFYYTKLRTLAAWTTVSAAAICVIRTRCVFGQTIGTGGVAVAVAIVAVGIGVAVIVDAVGTTRLGRWRCAAVFGAITLVLIRIAGFVTAISFYTGRVAVAIRVIAIGVCVAVIINAIGATGLR